MGAVGDWQSVPPLREAFAGRFLVGAALDWRQSAEGGTLATDIACRHFDAFTCENGMKPEATQPEEGRFTFELGDRMVAAAERCGATPVGHTLIWHSQTPAWFHTGPDGRPVSRDLALERMQTHIATVAGRYAGRVRQWDVVNEAISDAADEYLRPTPWLAALGDDYLVEAFHAARAADGGALLVYNDYNIDMAYKRPKALRLLRELLDRGAPVQAVGIQGHWRLHDLNLAEIETAIEAFAALGLKVLITELDIGVLPTRYRGADINHREPMTAEQRAELDPYTAGLPDDVAERLAEAYRAVFAIFMRWESVIERVTLWGTHDGASWLNGFPVPGRTDHPLLFDRQGRAKAAYYAVREAALAAD